MGCNNYSYRFFFHSEYLARKIVMDQEVESVGREERADTATVAVAESELAVENGAECDRKGKGKRGKHICPFPSCSAKVVHLPRHMRQVHKWEKEDSAGVVNAFRLRKDKKGSRKIEAET